MEKRKIAIAGGGGIGSYFCRDVATLILHEQFGAYRIYFVLYDDDTVDFKNLKYQNFEEFDLTDDKAEVLGERYDFDYEIKRIETEEELDKYDIIICAVDNPEFREMLFRWSDKNPDKYWIDLRSEGRSIAYFTKHKNNTLDVLLNSIKSAEKGDTSCQLAHELEKGIIQQGNKIIATIGSQLLLNHLRGEENPAKFIGRF